MRIVFEERGGMGRLGLRRLLGLKCFAMGGRGRLWRRNERSE
jgi:hypothetical protein